MRTSVGFLTPPVSAPLTGTVERSHGRDAALHAAIPTPPGSAAEKAGGAAAGTAGRRRLIQSPAKAMGLDDVGTVVDEAGRVNISLVTKLNPVRRSARDLVTRAHTRVGGSHGLPVPAERVRGT